MRAADTSVIALRLGHEKTDTVQIYLHAKAEAIAGFRHGVVGMSRPKGTYFRARRMARVSLLRPVRLVAAALGAWTSGLPQSRVALVTTLRR